MATTLYLGLGSNLGAREANLKRALAMFAPEIVVSKESPWYESEPMYNAAQPKFLNVVIRAATRLSAPGVLQKIKLIEKEMGEHEHNAPRIIDIDLLFYDSQVIETPELTVPHPKIAERPFVLAPLADIAPEFAHPVLGATVAELLRNMDLRNP